MININVQALLPGAKSTMKKSESVPTKRESLEDTFPGPSSMISQDITPEPVPETTARQSTMRTSLSFPEFELPPATETLKNLTKVRTLSAGYYAVNLTCAKAIVEINRYICMNASVAV